MSTTGFACDFVRATGAQGDSDSHPRWNLISRYDGGAPGQCVHFNSHYEVSHGWTRGTSDMKGGLVVSIIAAEAFIALNPTFAGSIEISAKVMALVLRDILQGPG